MNNDCKVTITVCPRGAKLDEETKRAFRKIAVLVKKAMLDGGFIMPRTKAEFLHVFPEAKKN